MFHLFVPSEAENKPDEWKKKNADLIFLSRIQEPLEDTTEISNGEKLNTYAFKIDDLVKYGDTVGRIVYDGGSEYKVKTSEGQKLTIQKEEIFLATENEQQVQIKKKMDILKAQIQEKEYEIEKIDEFISIETVRQQLQDAENAYRTTSWDTGNTLWNARKSVLAKLRKLLSDAPDGEDDYEQYDENATVKVLLEFEVNDLNKVTEDKRRAEFSMTMLQRQLKPQKEYLNSLEGVVTTQQQNKLLQDYEQERFILWTWRKCYDLTFDKFDNMKWKKRPSEVKEEKKLLNDYFQTTLSKDANKRLYEQYNSGTKDQVTALFDKVVKQMKTKRMEIMGQINAANDEVGFIIKCLEHFAMFQFCELYQRKLREITMLAKYTKKKKKKNN